MPDLTEGNAPLEDIQKAACPSRLRIGFHALDTIQRYQYFEPPKASEK